MQKIASPWQGATERRVASQVTLINGQPMRPQQNFELLEKRNASVMFFLSLNVTAHLGHLRLTNRERTVTLLPRESRGILERPRNPGRRVSLDLANELRDRLVLPQFGQDMNMVRGSVHDQRDSVFTANGATEVFMNAWTNSGRQPWLATLRRKDNVIEQIAIGGTHTEGPFRRPCSGAALSLHHTPGVPLRSTPGFIPAHPAGAVAEIRLGGRTQRISTRKGRCIPTLFLDHAPTVPLRSTPGFNPAHPPGAVEKILISGQTQRPSAPEARGNKARSEAKQTPGTQRDIGKPLTRGGRGRVWADRRISAGKTK